MFDRKNTEKKIGVYSKIMSKYVEICEYIYEYDFPVASMFDFYSEDIVENYFKKQQKEFAAGYSYEYENKHLCEKVSTAFEKIINDDFEVSERLNKTKLWTYVQNDEFFNCVSHNHVRSSTINAVFYINPPEKEGGGGLEYTIGNEVHTLYPQTNKLYVMPYWLYHRPLPQSEKKWRISVNIEYECSRRPVHKSGAVW